MRKIILTLISFIIFSNFYAQEKLEIKRIGFSIDIPQKWIFTSNEEVLKNLDNYNFTDKQLETLLKSTNASIGLATLVKYDPKTYPGIIPTIKIRTQEVKTKTFKNLQVSLNNLAKT